MPAYTGKISAIRGSDDNQYGVLDVEGRPSASVTFTVKTAWKSDRAPQTGDDVSIGRISPHRGGDRAFEVTLKN